MSENYERTHYGLNYKSAHEKSNKREEKFKFKSRTPGSIFYLNYMRPSKDALNKLYNENKKYLSE